MPDHTIAERPNYAARDDEAPMMTAGLLVRRPDVSSEMFTRYWRDVHGPLAARIRGFWQYWQHHLNAPVPDFWPIDVGQSVAPQFHIQGLAETTFRSAADRERLGEDPAAQALFYDEQNAFGATYLCPSAPGDTKTFHDEKADPAPQGSLGLPAYVVLLRRATGVSNEGFADLLRNDFAPMLASRGEVAKVRMHLLQPFDAAAWNTPGVVHDLPLDAQYQAVLEVAFRDDTAERELLSSTALGAAAERVASVVGAIHTYPIQATYTLVQDGRPTLVGLKGLSVAETILAVGARNQTSPDVLSLLHGPVTLYSRDEASAR